MFAYEETRSNIISQSRNISSADLGILKAAFKNVINSNRRLEQIVTVEGLINILEKRYALHESDVSAFSKIAAVLNISQVNIASRVNESLANTEHVYECGKRTLPNPSARIYKLIETEIGSKWKLLARNLKIREGQIDALENKYILTSERVHQILLKYEEEHSNNWFPLLDAQGMST